MAAVVAAPPQQEVALPPSPNVTSAVASAVVRPAPASAKSPASASVPKIQSHLIDDATKWNLFDIQARMVQPDKTLMALDAEWHDDILCLIQLAFYNLASGNQRNAPPITVLTIDCVTLDRHQIAVRIRPLLTDVRIRKLTFDCREDCRMLAEQLNIVPAGLFDLQLMEILTRPDLASRRPIVNVRGLKAMINEFSSLSAFIKAKDSQDLTMQGSSQVFHERPLSQAVLDYASCDVASLFTLFKELQERPGFRSNAGRVADETIRGTMAYATLSLEVPPDFRRHNMLPLGVLPSVSPAQGPRFCSGCRRPVAARDRDMCLICHAHSTRRDAYNPSGRSPQESPGRTETSPPASQGNSPNAPTAAAW